MLICKTHERELFISGYFKVKYVGLVKALDLTQDNQLVLMFSHNNMIEGSEYGSISMYQ